PVLMIFLTLPVYPTRCPLETRGAWTTLQRRSRSWNTTNSVLSLCKTALAMRLAAAYDAHKGDALNQRDTFSAQGEARRVSAQTPLYLRVRKRNVLRIGFGLVTALLAFSLFQAYKIQASPSDV